jgi:hypothetical protein
MLDPKEEKRFEELKGMCRELKVPAPPEIMIGLQVHDKDGSLTFDDVQRAHSWVRNMWNMMAQVGLGGVAGSTYAAGSLGGKKINGTIVDTISTTILSYAYIIVGTGDTATTILDYTLISPISSGNGAGQLLASAIVYGTPSYNAGTHVWSVTKSQIFNNNSGSSITVKEAAIAGISQEIIAERSVLSPTVAVANGAQLTVTYEISMDFSAID